MKVYGVTLLAALALGSPGAQAQPAPQPPPQRARNAAGAEPAPGRSRAADSAPAGKSSSSQTYFDLGVRYFLAGDGQRAVDAFSRAVKINPDYADAYFNLGNAYMLLSRWAEAGRAYNRALSLNPKDGSAYNNLGRVHYAQGAYKQASENFQRAIRIHPKWAEPHYRLSDTYYRLGDLSAAKSSYEKAVRLNPNDPARATALAASLRAAANAPAAAAGEQRAPSVTAPPKRAAKPAGEAGARDAAKERKNEAKAFYNQGVKHGRAKRYDEAIKAFRQAIERNPDYADAYFGLGHAYADSGLWQNAVEAYEQVVRLDPKDEEALYRLGEAYTKLRAQTAGEPANGGDGGGRPRGETVGLGDVKAETNPGSSTAAPPPAAVRPAASPENVSKTPPEPEAAARAAADAELTRIYRVGPGDVLDVRVLNGPASQSSSTLYTVTAGGLLDYPLAGEPLNVAGATTEEIGARIAAALKRLALAEKPEVAVGVREYASHNVIVSGLVREPGTKVLRREAVPLYVILADAQLLPEAEQVQISSAAGAKTTLSLADTPALDVLVRAGDVITVQTRPEQFFYIGGEVEAPGQKSFRPGMTLTQAVLAAGGKLSRGGSARLSRQSGRGFLSTSVYKLQDLTSGKVPDVLLQPDDRIEVIR